MIKRLSIIFVMSFSILACKSEFEKLRTSNDPEAVYAAANNYFEAGEWFKSQNLYELVIPFYRGKGEAQDLFYNYAYTHYNLEDFLLASHYFKSFGKSFYNSPKKEETEFMSAYSNYRMSPNYKLDQSYSKKAIEAFQSFINTYPNSERIHEVNSLIDEMRAKMEKKAYSQGELYYNLKSYNAAISSFESMLKDFPESKRSEEVRFLIIKANYEYALQSIFSKKAERFENVLTYVNRFRKKYPESPYLNEVLSIENDSSQNYNKYKS